MADIVTAPDAYTRALRDTVPGQIEDKASDLTPLLGALSLPYAGARFTGAAVADPVRAWLKDLVEGNLSPVGTRQHEGSTDLKDATGPALERSLNAVLGPLKGAFSDNKEAENTLVGPSASTALAPPAGPVTPVGTDRQNTMAPPHDAAPAGALPPAAAAAPAVGGLPAPGGAPHPSLLIERGAPQINAAPPAAAPKSTAMMAKFQELLEKIKPRGDGAMTQQQQEAAQRVFFAQLGQSAAKGHPASWSAPYADATMAGQNYTDHATAMNKAAELLDLNQQRDNAFKSVGFLDKTEDNSRADRKQSSDELHARNLEDLKAKELKINDEYKKALIDAKTDDRAIREAEMTYKIQKAQLAAANAGLDPMGRAMNSLKKYFPLDNNEQLFARYQGRSTDPNKGVFDEGDIVGLYKEHVKAAVGEGKQPAPFKQFKASVMGDAAGAAKVYNSPAELSAAKAAGAIKKGDTVQTSNGPRIVD